MGVWPNGNPLRPDYVTRRVRQIMVRCGLPVIRFHDLRHTAASLLAPHVTPSQLQEFLGHEDISTTLGIYMHVSIVDVFTDLMVWMGIRKIIEQVNANAVAA